MANFLSLREKFMKKGSRGGSENPPPDFEKAVGDAVKSELEKRITPNVPGARGTKGFSQDLKDFEKMGYKERLELSRKNPRLYRDLTARAMNGKE